MMALVLGDSIDNPISIDSSPSPVKAGLLSDRYDNGAMLVLLLFSHTCSEVVHVLDSSAHSDVN